MASQGEDGLEGKFSLGEKVVFIPSGKIYDFGYLSIRRGYAVVYEEGERNMQDSHVVNMDNLRKQDKK